VDESTKNTVTELQATIEQTKVFLTTMSADNINGNESTLSVTKFGPTQLSFSGRDWLHIWILPNLYFHVTTTHKGVAIGKADCLGKLSFNNGVFQPN